MPSLVGRALRKVPRFAPARVVTAPAGMPSTDGSTRRLTIYLHDHDPGAAVLLAAAQTAGVRRRPRAKRQAGAASAASGGGWAHCEP